MGSATQSHVAAGLSVFAGIWKNWCDPLTGKWERTFAVVTVPANELVTQIHDRMLAILPNDRFARWLNDEADPRVLLVPFPADQLAVSPQRSAALVGVPSGHGRMAWDQFAPGDTGRAARALETLPIIHKQGRRPIQAAIAIARAAIRP